MFRALAVLFSLLFVMMNVSAQDFEPGPPSPKEKVQALAALAQARDALFSLRRNGEAHRLLARIAVTLASAGDMAGTQEIVAILPSDLRNAMQPEIVAAQLRSGDLAAALQTATAIPAKNARAAALLLVVQAQVKTGDFDRAMRTVALIPPERLESVQALVEVAKQLNQAGKRSEATQLLQRAAAAAASWPASNDEASQCVLSVLAQITNAQENMGESTDAVKTLRLAKVRLPETDVGCRFATTPYLQDHARSEALQNEVAEFREILVPPGLAGNEEENQDDSSIAAGVPDALSESPSIGLHEFTQNGQATLTREAALAALDSLRTAKPLYMRAQAAIRTSELMLVNGKTDEAEEAMRIGLEAADPLQDQNLRGMLLTSRAHARAFAKNWRGAHAVVEEIADAQQRTAVLCGHRLPRGRKRASATGTLLGGHRGFASFASERSGLGRTSAAASAGFLRSVTLLDSWSHTRGLSPRRRPPHSKYQI